MPLRSSKVPNLNTI